MMVKVARYLPKSEQAFSGLYRRLQKKAYSWELKDLIVFAIVSGLQP